MSPVDVEVAVTSLIELLVENGEMAPQEVVEQTHWFLHGPVTALIFEWTRHEAPTGGGEEGAVGPA